MTQTATTLRRDCRGAMMIMGVFMLAILIGFLYYQVGLGDALLAQERMQDAADATAFSSAVIHARGMNLLALLNIIMAAGLAILVLLSLLSSLLNLGVKILVPAAVLAPYLSAAIPPMKSAASTVDAIKPGAERTINTLLRTCHALQGPLARNIPKIAALNALKMSTSHFDPVVQFGTTFPIMAGLPTEDGKFETLCDKAGQYVGELVVLPLKAVGVPDFVTNRLTGIAVKLGKGYARYYCGVGPKVSMPSIPVEVMAPKLTTPSQGKCESSDPKVATDQACKDYEKELKEFQAAYSEQDGTCGGPMEAQCNQARRGARTECDPQKNSNIKTITWREATKTYHYFVDGGANPFVNYTINEGPNGVDTNAKIRKKGQVPCGPDRIWGDSHMTDWNAEGPDKPLCTEMYTAPTLYELQRLPTMSKDITVREVTDVLWCVKNEYESEELDGKRLENKDMKKKVPQEMCNCAAQGEELFQVRSIVYGDSEPATRVADHRILAASGGKAPKDNFLTDLAEKGGRFAVAQAEYYYDDASAQPEEWLWHMRWKARMRRFSLNRKDWVCPKKKNTCQKQVKKSELAKLKLNVPGKLAGIKEKLGDGLSSVISH